MTNETDGMGFDIGLDGLSDLEDRTTTSGLEVAAENVTEIAKSYPTPNNDHVSALKEAPDLVGAFDDKFGAGQAARYLGEFDRGDIPEPPREITTSHVLDVMKGEPSPFEQVWSVLDDDAALTRQKRDVAILQSLSRARERPEKLGNWLDDEVRNATANYLILRKRAGDNPTEGMKSAVEAAEARFAMARDLQTRRPGWMDKQIASAKQRYEAANKALADAYESGIVPGAVEAEARTALHVAEAADKVAADRKEGIERRLGPVERINLAEKLADAEADVLLAQDELEAAKRTPGTDQAVYEERLVEARKRAQALKELQMWGEQRRPVDDAGFVGETLRGLSRGAMSVVPELLGGAAVQHGESAGNEGVKGFGELMRRYGRSVRQDTADRANPSILELDPKSPTFGRDLKRWLGGALGEAFGTTIPIMGAYAIGGPLAGGSVGLAMGQGEMRNRLEEAFAREGLELDKQKVESYVWVYGSAIGALDAWAGFFHLEGLSGAIKEQAKTTLVRTFAKGVAKGAAVEGLTEGMQEAIGMMGEAWAVEKGIDWKEFGKAFIESFSAGAVGGAGFGAMGTPQAYRAGKREEFQAKLREMQREVVDILQVEAEKKAEAEAKKATAGRPEAPVEGTAKVPVPEPEKPPAKADPGQDVLSFIRERGGLIDETGDLAAMDAPKSLINPKSGVPVDAMREALVEAGYLSEVEGEAVTTADDVYELVRRALAGERVYPIGQEDQVAAQDYEKNRANYLDAESNAIISELASYLEGNGVAYNLTDAEEAYVIDAVRNRSLDPLDALEEMVVARYNKGGLRRETQPTGPSVPSPALPQAGSGRASSGGTAAADSDGGTGRVSGGSGRKGGGEGTQITGRTLKALADYLNDGGSLATKAYADIAAKTGIEKGQVGDLLDSAERAQIVKRDRRGHPRRGPALADYRGEVSEDMDLKGSQTAVTGSIEAVRDVRAKLAAGKRVRLNTVASAKAAHEKIAPYRAAVHAETNVGVVLEMRPHGDQTEVSFMTEGGGRDTFWLSTADASDFRAVAVADFLTGSGRPALVFSGSDLSGDFGHRVAGEVYHESIHDLFRRGDLVGVWARLFGHAESLGVLDLPVQTYMRAIGDVHASVIPGTVTLREMYGQIYQKRGIDTNSLIEQEAVAIMAELEALGYWTPQEVAPIKPILDAIKTGSLPEYSGAYALAASPGLDMSPEARKARAEQMGFDTSKVLYHGSEQPVPESGFVVDFGQKRALRQPGVFFSESPDVSSTVYAFGPERDVRFDPASGSVVDVDPRPLGRPSVGAFYLRRGRHYVLDVVDLEPQLRDFDTLAEAQGAHPDLPDRITAKLWELKAQGYDSVAIRNNPDGNSFIKNGDLAIADEIVVFDPTNIRSVNAAFDPSRADSPNLMFAASADAAIGKSMRRDLDKLGFYSGLLEAAKGLKQAKGMPEQMRAMLMEAAGKGAKAEADATELDKFLEGKKRVSKQELIEFLESRRVVLNEAVSGEPKRYPIAYEVNEEEPHLIDVYVDDGHYIMEAQIVMKPGQIVVNGLDNGRSTSKYFNHTNTPAGREQGLAEAKAWIEQHDQLVRYDDSTMFSRFSLDPDNPTYREVRLHLPSKDEGWDVYRRAGDEDTFVTRVADRMVAEAMVRDDPQLFWERANGGEILDFRRGHFPEPNIIGHAMISMVKHDGKPVLLADQIQSDWGQRLRDIARGKSNMDGVLNELAVSILESQLEEAQAVIDKMQKAPEDITEGDPVAPWPFHYPLRDDAVSIAKTAIFKKDGVDPEETYGYIDPYDYVEYWVAERDRLRGEISIKKSMPAELTHPLVANTDQWTNTVLRRLIRIAVEGGADYIAIPSGATVESYNPQGDSLGNAEFYDVIVPKNLRNILQKIDKDAAKSIRVRTLTTPTPLPRDQVRPSDEAAAPFLDEWNSLNEQIRQARDEHEKLSLESFRLSAAQKFDTRLIDKIERLRVRILDLENSREALHERMVDREIELSPGGSRGRGFTLYRLTDKVRQAVLENGLPMFAAGGARAAEPGLHALHNLSAENLRFADEVGGLAVPSIAVTKQGVGLEGFGEITLIGTRDLVDPATTPVHDADAYTTRFPRPEYKPVKTKVAQKLVDEMRPFAAKFDDTSSMHEAWDYMVNTPKPDEVIGKLLRSEAAQAWFLSTKGITVEPVMRDALSHSRFPWVNTKAFRAFVEANPGWTSYEFDRAKTGQAVAAAIDEYVDGMRTKNGKRVTKKIREDLRELYRGFLNENGEITLHPDYVHSDFIKVGKQVVDLGPTRDALRAALEPYQVEFKRWLDEKFGGVFGEPSLKLGRRKVPYTLANIVEAMTSAKVKGEEQTMTFGEGMARAMSSQRIRDLTEMRNRAGWQIAGPKEVEAAREKAKELLEAWRNDIVKRYKYYRAEGRESFGSVWEALDSSMRALARWASRGGLNTQNLATALRREEFTGFTQDELEAGVEAGKAFLDAPVPYFEAKPQRGVGLDEFVGALVPDNADPDVIAILEKHGIAVKTYDRKAADRYTQADEAALFAAELEARGAMFALAGRQMPGGQIRMSSPGLNAPAKSLAELIQDVIKALAIVTPQGYTVRQGRLNPGLKAQAGARGGKLLGQHNANTGVTRLAVPMDIETLSHEGGHAIEARFGFDLRNLMQRFAHELEPLATPGKDQLSEGFAEFFRRYVTNPTNAENVAPDFMNNFEDFLDAQEPGLRDALEKIQVGYQDWINAPSGGVIASSVQSAQKPSLIQTMIKKVNDRGFRDVARDYGDRIYTALIDDLHPVKVAVDRLVETASENINVTLAAGQRLGVTAANDAYKLLRLARMAYQGGHVALMEGVRPYHGTTFGGASWREAMGVALGGFEAEQWSKERMRAFDAYLTSRRMVKEWERFQAGDLARPPDKYSKADHEQSIRDYEAAYPSFVDGARLMYEFQYNLLKLARDSGFLTEEQFTKFADRNDYYVPLNRIMDDESKVGAGSVPKDAARKPANLGKQFKGSMRDVISPTESIAKFTYELHYLIARNDAIKALDALARAAGPGGGAIAERVPNSQIKGTNVDAIEVVTAAAKAQGIDEADLIFMIKAIEDTLGEETGATVFRAGEISPAGEPIVFLWENGKRVPIRLADGQFGKDVFEAVTGMGREWHGFWVAVPALMSTSLRAGVTLDPAFFFANFFRDQLATFINTSDYIPFYSGLQGSAEAIEAMAGGTPENLTLANSLGLIMGGEGVGAIHEARVKRDVEKLRKKGVLLREAANPFNRKFWELTGITETGTRVGVFRNARARALADGLSEYEAVIEAAYAANDIIDFSRHGSKMIVARRLFTFLNAALQGMERSLRTGTGRTENPRAIRDMISPYIKSRTGQPLTVLERKRVPESARFWVKVMVPMAIAGIAQSLLYGDDPDYEEVPEYFRNTHWLFKLPDGTWLRLPKPFELGAFSLIAERTFERVYKGDEVALDRMRRGLFELVLPPHTIPGIWTAAELWANKSAFTGRSIVPYNLEGMGGELEATAYTSEFSKTLAQWTGVSAAKLDHFIVGVTGGLGRMALDASNQAFPAIGRGLEGVSLPTMGFPTQERTAIRQSDIPVVRRFTMDPVKSSQSKREFYDQMAFRAGEMTRMADRYKELWDRGQILEAQNSIERGSENQKLYALLENHGQTSEKRLHPMNRARDVISVTRGVLREIGTGELKKADRTDYSPSERKAIKEMIEMIQMREARNAMIVIGEPGYRQKRILDVDPVMREFRTKAPDLFEEMEYRLNRKKIQPFEDVVAEWPALKERVLAPGYAQDNPPRRAAGRRSGYDVELSP